MALGFESIFLIVVALVALLIILVTAVAVVVALRRSGKQPSQQQNGDSALSEDASDGISPETTINRPQPTQPTYVPTPQEDIETYLSEQRANLSEFELTDLSNTFKGTTNEGQRKGVLLHLTREDTPLIAFTSQAFNRQNGTINAETIYGKMELIIAQGKAGVKWEGEPIGIIEYGKQRILGPEGQLLGSLERPANKSDVGSYAVSFVGQKAADVTTKVNAISTLRWFGGEESEQLPAFQNVYPDLEDKQTLLLMSILLLEISFFDMLS